MIVPAAGGGCGAVCLVVGFLVVGTKKGDARFLRLESPFGLLLFRSPFYLF